MRREIVETMTGPKEILVVASWRWLGRTWWLHRRVLRRGWTVTDARTSYGAVHGRTLAGAVVTYWWKVGTAVWRGDWRHRIQYAELHRVTGWRT